MPGAFHGRTHGRGDLYHWSADSALATAGTLILTLLALVVLFFCLFASRAG